MAATFDAARGTKMDRPQQIRIDRRQFVHVFGGLLWGCANILQVCQAVAQTRMRKLGFITTGSAAGTKDRDACFSAGLRQLGWIEGQNITIERRWADGDVLRLPGLVSELSSLRPDVILTAGTPASQAAQKIIRDVPIVFSMVSDPVASGIVSNLARPDANITGISNFFPAMISKLLELIVMASTAKHVAVLHDPANQGKQLEMRSLLESGRAMQIFIDSVELRNKIDVEEAFAAMTKKKPDALIVLVDAVTNANAELIINRASNLGLAAIYQERTFVDRGGLMSYALDYCKHFQRAATYADKILKGERASNLPVEQPATFQFAINLKTAKSMGLNLPPSVLAFADEVIE